MNLANLGKAGLLVAQNRLATAGHNINNAATVGFNRQTVLSQTAGATPTSAGWIGRGVQAVSVMRSYDNFLYTQLTGSITKGAALKTYGDQVAQVNNLFADRTVGISPNIQQFFNALEAVATAPADVAGRQELLGRANSLATQVRDANAFLDDQRKNVNTQITTTVTQVNSYLDRILDMNRQITTAQATNPGQPPNDLLDQRDQLASELGQLIDVQVYEQDGRFNITIGNGQTVLGGDTAYHLEARPSAADPSRTVVNYTVPGGGQVEMPDKYLTGGKLGGLLTFRSDVLDVTQNDLGRIALGISMSINAQHMQGYDPSGEKGGYFFSTNDITGAQAKAAAGNAATGTPKLTVADPTRVPNESYRVTYDGTQYTVTKTPETAPPVSGTFAGPTGSFDGVDFDFGGMTPAPANGDAWDIQLISQPLSKVIGDAKNAAGAGSPVASIQDISKVTNQDYQIKFVDDGAGGGDYSVMRVPEGSVVGSIPKDGKLTVDGVEIDTAGMTPGNGNTWLIQPTRAAAGELDVALTDPSKFAAAGWNADDNAPAGSANGDNALKLAQLRSIKTLGGLPGSTTGTMDLNEAYSQLVNGVAVKTQSNGTAQKAQESLIQQNYSAQQAVSGVNLDEEYINIQRFQEQYRAAARLIDTASTLFDTLLSLRS
ncbi:flagellar hook-associated protein FlgK [Castellaniella sp.]|uniref:flagellar hook-associated protein FlgK n=1 Tax=Castellaniella sp. TaxID=1955812 RepID=UPI002B003927|nr:flagellar hook-associated protein FlgK [Castellaniella sp.]